VTGSHGGTEAPTAPSLGKRATTAAAWVVVLRGTTRGASAIRIFILAQLLAPADIGLFGIALLAMATLEHFSESGFREALIQRKGNVDDFLATAWTFQIIRGLALAGLLFGFAPWIAELFRESAATPVLRAIAAVVAIRAMENVAIVYLQKELTFGRFFVYQAAGNLTDLVVAVLVALVWPSHWALVVALLAATIVRVLVSYALAPWKVSFRFDVAQLVQLFDFGRWVYLNRVTNFLALRGDQFIVARLLGPAALGVYQVTFVLADVLTKEISNALGLVAFPAYSLIQAEHARLRRAFLLTFETVASLVLPITLLTILLARPIVDTVLPSEGWAGVADVLPFLVGAGALRAVVATGGSVYLAVGKPGYSFQINAGRVVVLFGTIWPLVTVYGLRGAGIAVLVSAFAMLPPFFVRLRELLDITFTQVLSALMPALALTAAVSLSCEASTRAITGSPLVVPLASAILAYALVALGLWQVSGTGPVRLALRLRGPASA